MCFTYSTVCRLPQVVCSFTLCQMQLRCIKRIDIMNLESHSVSHFPIPLNCYTNPTGDKTTSNPKPQGRKYLFQSSLVNICRMSTLNTGWLRMGTWDANIIFGNNFQYFQSTVKHLYPETSLNTYKQNCLQERLEVYHFIEAPFLGEDTTHFMQPNGCGLKSKDPNCVTIEFQTTMPNHLFTSQNPDTKAMLHHLTATPNLKKAGHWIWKLNVFMCFVKTPMNKSSPKRCGCLAATLNQYRHAGNLENQRTSCYQRFHWL